METQPVGWLNKPTIGYALNVEPSEETKQAFAEIQQRMRDAFPDVAYYMPARSMHITLLDWISPLVGYNGHDKQQLFTEIEPAYDAAMSEILSHIDPFTVHFTEVSAAPSTVFVLGTDDGQFQHIRQQFLEKTTLLPETKMPPQIIHSSLARFTTKVELEPLQQFAASTPVDIHEKVSEVRLVKTLREPLVEFEVLKRYPLGN